MKTQINSAQVVVPCRKFDESLAFFTDTLGFRVEMIFPADAPSVAVIAGYGVVLRMEKSDEIQPLTLRLSGDFAASELFSPDGVRICLVSDQAAFEIPETRQELVVSAFDGADSFSAGRAGMLYRDLIPGRLGGGFVASHISIPVGGEVPDYVHFHKVRFQMLYCVAGWAKLVYENQGAPFVMNAGDCVLQPPEIRHQVLESSDKFEVLEIGCPAIHETYADHQTPLPNHVVAADVIYGGQTFIHHAAEKSGWNASEIAGFESRDTGILRATNGLADVRVLRAIADVDFSVCHQDEFLFFFILEGNL
ncbi:MAG: cupin, partial [Acidobacteriota bacterium]|nr:cupin [Acidobacteriota bacterium]